MPTARRSSGNKLVKENIVNKNLLDISQIYDLEKQRIDRACEEYRKNKYSDLEDRRSNHDSARVELEKERILAEKKFPYALKEIDISIKRAIDVDENFTDFDVDSPNIGLEDHQLSMMYLLVMLMETLTLHGYSCELKDYTINLSW